MQAWLAFWMDGKIRRSKTFSSKVHGFEGSRLMAIDFLRSKRRESGLGSPEPDDEEPYKPLTREVSTSTTDSSRVGLSAVSTVLVQIAKSA